MTDTHPDGKRGKPARVLVLDDHGISRRYAVAALRQAGVAVKASGNPAAALRTALEWLPHAVVVDVGLPGTDGRQWIERLRRQWPGGRPQPRFVLLSAERPEPDEDGHPSCAPATRLRKPASPPELSTARVERGLRLFLGLCRSHAATTGGSAEIARSYFELLGVAAPLIDAPAARSG